MNEQVESPVGQRGRLIWLCDISPLFVHHPRGRKGDCLEDETDEISIAEEFGKDTGAHSLSGDVGILFFMRR